MTRNKCQLEESKMDNHIKELFANATRFDESELTKLEDYQLKEKITFQMEELAELKYGKEAGKFLEEYLLAIHEAFQYELLHYFEQGYLAAKAEMGTQA